MNERAFTSRSILLGLIGVLVVATFPSYCYDVLKLEKAIRGYLPIIPLSAIVLLSFVWNRVGGRINRRLALGTKELAVIFCLMMITAWVPGLVRSLVRHLALARYEELTTNAIWEEAQITTRLPDALFPKGEDGGSIGEQVHFGFIQGGMSLQDIPFSAWVQPLLHWMPLLVVFSLCLFALSFLVHRQWTVHEQLRYPLVSVANALIRQDGKRLGGAIYRNRLFWFAFLFVFCFIMFRYLEVWFPGKVPRLENEHSLVWQNLFPVIKTSNATMFLLEWMPLSFAIIGIAYFVPTDVSLSIGLTAPIGTLLGVQYYLATGNMVSPNELDMFRAGGFIAFGLILAYTGRAYYGPILLTAIVPGYRKKEIDPGGVWAARIFLICYIALTAVVRAMGVDLFIAWILVTFLLLVFLVVSRLVCETGIPTIAAEWFLPGLLTGLFGPAALGATPLVFITLLSNTIVTSKSTQLIMPFMTTSLKILDDNNVNLRRFAVVSKVAILIALVAGFTAVLTVAYTSGAGNLTRDERSHMNKGARAVLDLNDFGQMDVSEATHGLSKIALFSPDSGTMGLVLAGLIAVAVTYMLRFRFSKWPLHPLFFIVLGSEVGMTSWYCFLLGWLIKVLVVKFGGGRIFHAAKPLFIGLIAGEFFSQGLMLFIAYIYHLITGDQPVTLWML